MRIFFVLSIGNKKKTHFEHVADDDHSKVTEGALAPHHPQAGQQAPHTPQQVVVVHHQPPPHLAQVGEAQWRPLAFTLEKKT